MRLLAFAVMMIVLPMQAAAATPAAQEPATGAAPAAKKAETGADLVDVQELIPDLVLDFRYATEKNFIGRKVYPDSARCYLRRAVAARLVKVADRLRKEDGTRLRVFDCYRPLSVQKEMWKIFPRPGYVANPKGGSVHNRGAAVDLTLATPAGEALEMPTDFDTFDERAWLNYAGGTAVSRQNRDRLRAAMQAEGFRTIRKEWWHYEAPDRSTYPVLDLSFEELSARTTR